MSLGCHSRQRARGWGLSLGGGQDPTCILFSCPLLWKGGHDSLQNARRDGSPPGASGETEAQSEAGTCTMPRVCPDRDGGSGGITRATRLPDPIRLQRPCPCHGTQGLCCPPGLHLRGLRRQPAPQQPPRAARGRSLAKGAGGEGAVLEQHVLTIVSPIAAMTWDGYRVWGPRAHLG